MKHMTGDTALVTVGQVAAAKRALRERKVADRDALNADIEKLDAWLAAAAVIAGEDVLNETVAQVEDDEEIDSIVDEENMADASQRILGSFPKGSLIRNCSPNSAGFRGLRNVSIKSELLLHDGVTSDKARRDCEVPQGAAFAAEGRGRVGGHIARRLVPVCIQAIALVQVAATIRVAGLGCQPGPATNPGGATETLGDFKEVGAMQPP